NVPACLAILNKRKPESRKNRVLMIWASRDYQHANPQCILRRADCLRILLPWRAFGDREQALTILPAESQAILNEIVHDRTHSLQQISDAYDPVIAALPVLRAEVESLSPAGFRQWQKNPDAAHPTWGALVADAKIIAGLTARLTAMGPKDA